MILLGLRNENNADNYELLLACAVAQVLESPSGKLITLKKKKKKKKNFILIKTLKNN